MRVAGLSFMLFISAAAAHAGNDSCAEATLLPGLVSQSVTVDLEGAALSDSEACGDGRTRWYRYTPPRTGALAVSACGAEGQASIEVLSGCGGESLYCAPQACPQGPEEAWFPVTQGQQVYIRASSTQEDLAPFTLSLNLLEYRDGVVEPIIPGDICELPAPIVFTNGDNSRSFQFVFNGLTPSGTGEFCAGQGAVDAWFEYSATQAGYLYLSACSFTTDPTLEVYDSCGALARLCNEAGCPDTQQDGFFRVRAGRDYLIRCTGEREHVAALAVDFAGERSAVVSFRRSGEPGFVPSPPSSGERDRVRGPAPDEPSLESTAIEVDPLQQFTVDVNVELRDTSLGSFLLDINYDPTLLSVVSVAAGSGCISGDCGAQPYPFTSVFTNAASFATGKTPIAAVHPGIDYPTGTLNVAKVTFQAANAPGSSSVLLPQAGTDPGSVPGAGLGVGELYSADIDPLPIPVVPVVQAVQIKAQQFIPTLFVQVFDRRDASPIPNASVKVGSTTVGCGGGCNTGSYSTTLPGCPCSLFITVQAPGFAEATRFVTVGGAISSETFYLDVENFHSADADRDGRMDLGELLESVQLFNAALGYYCRPQTAGEVCEYTPVPATNGRSGATHSADFFPADWTITLSELLRQVQLFNLGPFQACTDTEDGFCPKP